VSGGRFEPLNDDEALDRAIDAALDVEPRGDFAARVRERIAGERRAWAAWPLGVAGLAAAAVLIAMVWMPRSPVNTSSGGPAPLAGGAEAPPPRASRSTAPPPQQVEGTAAPPQAPESTAPPLQVRESAAPPRRAPGRGTPPRPREPEVLVAKDEMDAFRRFLTAASQGRVRELPVPDMEIDPDTGMPHPAPLVIEPIHIEPL